jgi:hypothetical protein|tara:strand:+ start:744 stop:1565 length:822 start_codon:yes stop_codon:yes gene_type:complete
MDGADGGAAGGGGGGLASISERFPSRPKPDGKVPFLQKIHPDYRFFSKGDMDSFFTVFSDQISSLIAILSVMAVAIPTAALPSGTNLDDNGDPYDYDQHLVKFKRMIWLRVGPGLAFANAFGNLWYAWMAAKLAGYERRTDVTALPYGVNTPAGLISGWIIMLPIARSLLSEEPGMPGECTAHLLPWFEYATLLPTNHRMYCPWRASVSLPHLSKMPHPFLRTTGCHFSEGKSHSPFSPYVTLPFFLHISGCFFSERQVSPSHPSSDVSHSTS